MDILFVTLSPIDVTFSMAHCNRAIIKGFVELGHNVDVLTTHPYDNKIQVPLSDVFQKVNIVSIDKGLAQRTGVIPIRQGNTSLVTKVVRFFYHRLVPFDSSYFLIRKVDLDILPKKKYDVLVSSSDPKTSHIATENLILMGLVYGRWIQYWGDPFTNDISSKLIYPKSFIRLLEKRILKRADKIVYISPITVKEQGQMFPRYHAKMSFVPTPFEKEKIYPDTNNSSFRIGYFGFYLKAVRNILPLYNAIKKCSENIHLDIVGTTDMDLENQTNISIHPNTNDISLFEKSADLIVALLNLKGGQIPGKLYHLAGTNRPVLVILDGDFKTEFEEHLRPFNRFIFCENREDEILLAIKQIMYQNIRFEPCVQLSSAVVSQQFLS